MVQHPEWLSRMTKCWGQNTETFVTHITSETILIKEEWEIDPGPFLPSAEFQQWMLWITHYPCWSLPKSAAAENFHCRHTPSVAIFRLKQALRGDHDACTSLWQTSTFVMMSAMLIPIPRPSIQSNLNAVCTLLVSADARKSHKFSHNHTTDLESLIKV